jgi:hypothetical protein
LAVAAAIVPAALSADDRARLAAIVERVVVSESFVEIHLVDQVARGSLAREPDSGRLGRAEKHKGTAGRCAARGTRKTVDSAPPDAERTPNTHS